MRNDYGSSPRSDRMIESMVEPVQSLAAESPLLLALVVLAVVAVAITAIKIAISIAIRVGLIAAVVLAGFYTVGYLL